MRKTITVICKVFPRPLHILYILLILLALPWRVEAGDFGDSLKPGQFTAPSGRRWQANRAR